MSSFRPAVMGLLRPASCKLIHSSVDFHGMSRLARKKKSKEKQLKNFFFIRKKNKKKTWVGQIFEKKTPRFRIKIRVVPDIRYPAGYSVSFAGYPAKENCLKSETVLTNKLYQYITEIYIRILYYFMDRIYYIYRLLNRVSRFVEN